jgi:hypothetical protein
MAQVIQETPVHFSSRFSFLMMCKQIHQSIEKMHAEDGSNKPSNGVDAVVYYSEVAGRLAVSDASTLSTCLKNHFIQTKPKGRDPIKNLTTTASAARHAKNGLQVTLWRKARRNSKRKLSVESVWIVIGYVNNLADLVATSTRYVCSTSVWLHPFTALWKARTKSKSKSKVHDCQGNHMRPPRWPKVQKSKLSAPRSSSFPAQRRSRAHSRVGCR